MKKQFSTLMLLTVTSLSLATPVFATSDASQTIYPEPDQSKILYHGISVEEARERFAKDYPGQEFKVEYVVNGLGGMTIPVEESGSKILYHGISVEEARERFAKDYPGQEFKVEYVANGLGGASLVNKETGEVYSYDPATGQRYSLEQLLALGKISEEEYQVYVAARQATQSIEEMANNLEGMTIPVDNSTTVATSAAIPENQELSEAPVPAVGAEETISVSESSKEATPSRSETKVLPKTSDSTSMVAILGVVMSLLGLVGFKKRSNQC